MAYGRRRMRRGLGRSQMRRGGLAGRAARIVARKAFRGAMRMSKRRLARAYATKCGQVSWRATRVLGRRAARYGNRRGMRRGRMGRRMRRIM